jgi:hypothetical protein
LRDYDFLNLSPPEFEDLTRDLLQKELGLTLETFTTGADKGIDIRYAFSKKNKLIVQCKRYKSYSSLISNLKKEKKKVLKLKPKRYVVVTSVGLTPNQKDEIEKLFSPYIISPSDILGRNDLNNLLGLHPDIEKSHFKLWLSSTNILQQIIHGRIHNQSNFEEEHVRETVRIYVENESYYNAVDIIKNKKYVIISGIPGIGKTTLARILVYHFLANGFKEFIFLSDSIKEAYDVYQEGVSQIFLFDDFLGRNFLENKLVNNEEQRIVKFIDKVSKSKDKILILTTREYILTQAKQRYDIFDNKSLEFAKCVIDLSQYTKLVRAKILYNHIFFSKMTSNYIEAFLKKESYLEIINHRNYNPRIIETITNDEVWAKIDPKMFITKIMSFLDYPENIWKHVYENQISKFSQCVLANLMSAGTPIFLEDLKILIQNFARSKSSKYGIIYSELEFKKSIRELENTFIITSKDNSNGLAVNYQNPSVQDFLVKYFIDFPDFISDIISTAIYFNQLFRVFANSGGSDNENDSDAINRIVLADSTRNQLIDKLLKDYEFLNSSEVSQVHYKADKSFRWVKEGYTDYKKLTIIRKEFRLNQHPRVKEFVSNIFSKMIIPTELSDSDLSDYLDILKEFRNDFKYDKTEIITEYFKSVYYISQLFNFEKFEKIFPKEYSEFIQSEVFIDRVSDLISDEAAESDEAHLEDTLEEIKSVSSKFGIDTDRAEEKVQERIDNKNQRDEEAYNWDDEYRPSGHSVGQNYDSEIESMFDSLRGEERDVDTSE